MRHFAQNPLVLISAHPELVEGSKGAGAGPAGFDKLSLSGRGSNKQ
jgi:hypothetical protein